MSHPDLDFDRRRMLAALAAGGAMAWPLGGVAHAGGLLGGVGIGAGGLGDTLGKASDSALDKLGVPGAFYADPAVRIGLPLLGGGNLLGGVLGNSGVGGALGQALGAGGKLGLTDGLVKKLNDAAGLAAQQAKPVFRAAISKLSLADVPGIVSQNDGATQYLKKSSTADLTAKLRPMIDSGLTKVGAYRLFDQLAGKQKLADLAGLTRNKLGASVTDQALNGIFKYMGSEEGKLRANPLGAAGALGKVLDGLRGN